MTYNLSKQEIETLRNLYIEGKLSREEEKALFLFLSSPHSLSMEEENLFELMQIEKEIFSAVKINKSRKNQFVSLVAASIILVISLALFSSIYLIKDSKEEIYTVWQNGEKLSEEEAKRVAEENQQQDMEMIRQVMRNQRNMIKRNFASVNMEDYDL